MSDDQYIQSVCKTIRRLSNIILLLGLVLVVLGIVRFFNDTPGAGKTVLIGVAAIVARFIEPIIEFAITAKRW